MAEKFESVNLPEFINSMVPATSGGAMPTWHYGREEDALIFYFRSDADYAKRLNKRVTIYLSLEGNHLVGCQIKGVRHVLEDIGSFDVTIKHGVVRLQMIFLAFLGTLDTPEDRNAFRQLAEEAQKADIKIPQCA